MSGILRLESLTKGNILRQGDLTLLKYRLFDADGDKLYISGKPATVRLMKDSFTFIAYEKEGLTVAPDDTISFSVNKILPAGLYHLEAIVDDKYIFPSRDDEGEFNVDLSTLGADINIVEATGVEAVARKATGMMKQDEEFIDDMIANVISDTNVGNIEEYYNQFNEATTEFESLKTQTLNSVTKSDKAIIDSASAKSIAQGIDAKATNALSLSESADTLSKSVQEQFNQVVIEGDSSVESAQARVSVDGEVNATLKERLDKEYTEIATQLVPLGHITTAPNGQMYNTNTTIKDALPSVTLSDVEAVDANATLDDSVDWFILQKFINECAITKTRSIRIPEGTYYMSRGLDLSGLEYDSHVNAHGVKLRFVEQSDYAVLLEHRGNYWKGRRANIEGLEIRGAYMCKVGVLVQGVQEWILSNVRIHECHIGVLMEDTWYGDINTMTIIENCLIAIDFGRRNTNEINTIGFNNIKINAINTLGQKQRFIPKNAGETDEDYDERVSFIGVRLGGLMGGINFFKLTIEGADYAYKYESKASTGSYQGFMSGVISIENNYLESIKKSFFEFRIPSSGNRKSVEYGYKLDIKGTRVHGTPKYPSYFTDGFYHIVQNQEFDVIFEFVGLSRLGATIDESVNLVEVIGLAYITKTRNNLLANPQKFGFYGDTNQFLVPRTALPSIQDKEYKMIPTLWGMSPSPNDTNVKIHNISSVSTVPVTFARSFGNKNGPVIQSDDGRFHMLQVSNDGTLYTRRVVNLQRLNHIFTAKTAKELYESINYYELGDTVRCIDTTHDVTLELVEGDKKWVINGAVAIGTSEELLKNPNVSRRWFDVSTHQGIYMDGSNRHMFYDWYGLVTTTRAYGTLSQRPSDPPNDFIYYARDEKKYYKFTDGEYSEVQPNV